MVFYKECPNCHQEKAWRFTIWLFILLTILGLIPGLIYWWVKVLQLRCEKCGIVTQSIVLNNAHTSSVNKPLGDFRTKKMLYNQATVQIMEEKTAEAEAKILKNTTEQTRKAKEEAEKLIKEHADFKKLLERKKQSKDN